jgi:hypothetical protein
MTGEDGPGQVIEASLTGGAFVALAGGLGVIVSLFDLLGGGSMGTGHSVGPAPRPHRLEALEILNQVLNLQHHPSIIRGLACGGSS